MSNLHQGFGQANIQDILEPVIESKMISGLINSIMKAIKTSSVTGCFVVRDMVRMTGRTAVTLQNCSICSVDRSRESESRYPQYLTQQDSRLSSACEG